MSSPTPTPASHGGSVSVSDTSASAKPPNETSAIPDEAPSPEDTDPELSTLKVVLLMVSSLLSMTLVALDRTIITTAIPEITNDFNSLSNIGWYGSSYLMTCGAFQLLFGKLYTFYNAKAVLVTSILLFEIASAICGAAPTSIAFIVGRAVAGIGAAGILAGSVTTTVYCIPLKKRPAIQGVIGAVFGLGIILGPLIGGAFTSHVSWRWCFYINLPIGGVAMIVTVICLEIPKQDTAKIPWANKLRQLDLLGSACLVPSVICLVLALQWGGQTYPWNNGRIIALLTVMSALIVAFVVVQISFPKTAMLPTRLFKQRSIVGGLWQVFFLGAGMYIIIYFLPVWFQSIKGDSAVESGVRLLPLMLAMLISSIIFGAVTQKLGYYTPFGIAGAIIMTVGAGLLTTLNVNTENKTWIGYQILFGFGMGLSFQTPSIAAQTVLSKKDVPTGLALNFFAQLIGGAISIPIGESILATQLLKRLSGITGFERSLVTSGGATALISALPGNLKPVVLEAYNGALRDVFVVGLVMSSLTILGACALEWKSTLDVPEGTKLAEGTKIGEGDEEKAAPVASDKALRE